MRRARFHVGSAEKTRSFGRLLGEIAPQGTALILLGEVGAGKSTLAQGVLEAWAGVMDAQSPTFTLIHAYPQEVYHADLYRLTEEEAQGIGLEEIFHTSSRSIVEWGDRAPSLLPGERLTLILVTLGEGREIRAQASGHHHEQLLERLTVAAGTAFRRGEGKE